MNITVSRLGILLSAFFWTYTLLLFVSGWLVRALVDFLKSKGVDLRPVNKTKGPKDNVIGHRFAVGPDYDKGYQVGFSYRPGVTEDYIPPIALPYAVRGNWILWWIEAPDAVWEKVLAAFKEYRGGSRIRNNPHAVDRSTVPFKGLGTSSTIPSVLSGWLTNTGRLPQTIPPASLRQMRPATFRG